jgi:hypothetical protein
MWLVAAMVPAQESCSINALQMQQAHSPAAGKLAILYCWSFD